MNEQQVRDMIGDVKAGRVSRRAFVRRMVGLGLTAPFAATLLKHAGVAAEPGGKFDYKPTKAGGGGALKMLFWQGPTLLNPHFAVGTKDQEGSRIFYEPLAAGTPTATWCRCSPPKSRKSRTAGSRRTACRSPGSSRRTCSGTTASRSPPTMSCSTGNTPSRPGDRCDDDRQYKDVKVREDRRLHRAGALRQADAVLGGRRSPARPA